MRTMRSEGGTWRDSRRNPEGGVWCSTVSTGVHNAGNPLADDGATGGVQPFVPCSGRSRPRGGLLSEWLNREELARPCRDGVGGVSAVGGEHAVDMANATKTPERKNRSKCDQIRGGAQAEETRVNCSSRYCVSTCVAHNGGVDRGEHESSGGICYVIVHEMTDDASQTPQAVRGRSSSDQHV